MKFLIYTSITLVGLSSCSKEEVATTEIKAQPVQSMTSTTIHSDWVVYEDFAEQVVSLTSGEKVKVHRVMDSAIHSEISHFPKWRVVELLKIQSEKETIRLETEAQNKKLANGSLEDKEAWRAEWREKYEGKLRLLARKELELTRNPTPPQPSKDEKKEFMERISALGPSLFENDIILFDAVLEDLKEKHKDAPVAISYDPDYLRLQELRPLVPTN